MQAHEQTEFLRAISLYIREQVCASTAPLLLKIERLEEQLAAIPVIEEGDIVELTCDAVMKSIPQPKDGKDADLMQIATMIDNKAKEQLKLFVQDIDFRFSKHDEVIALYVNEAIGKLPNPKDGKDGVDGKDAEIPWDFLNEQLQAGMEMVRDQLDKKIEALPKPKDGKDGIDGTDAKIDYDFLKGVMEDIVKSFPRPKDGKDGIDGVPGKDGKDGNDVSIVDLHPVVAAAVTKAVAALPRPVDVADCILDRDGNLCITFSNGIVKQVGRVVGKDGKDIDYEQVRGYLREMVAAIEKPTNGKDGKDGIGFPYISLEQIDDRHFELVITNEDKTHERRCQFEVRQEIHRGIWKEGKYERDDRVTWNGSEWIAKCDTQVAPGTGNGDWMLTVKCGRDGRKGDKGDPGLPGKNGDNGRDGRDLTQIGFDGKKWS